MKIILTLFLFVLLTNFADAQAVDAEQKFEKSKPRLTLELLSMGEDASSGYDYLVYRNRSGIVKIREIWSSSSGENPRVVDYYYENGRLVLLVRKNAAAKQYRQLAKGGNLPLATAEKCFVDGDRMTAWEEKGKRVPPTDARWAEKEKDTLELGRSQLDNYKLLKELN
jgi:hypothetical protein